MDLMLDPACEYNTWSDALKVGLACDEARFMWLEDPYKDGGTSAFGSRTALIAAAASDSTGLSFFGLSFFASGLGSAFASLG